MQYHLAQVDAQVDTEYHLAPVDAQVDAEYHLAQVDAHVDAQVDAKYHLAQVDAQVDAQVVAEYYLAQVDAQVDAEYHLAQVAVVLHLHSRACMQPNYIITSTSSVVILAHPVHPGQSSELLLARRSHRAEHLCDRTFILPICLSTREQWQHGRLDPHAVWGGEWGRARYGCIRFWW